MEVGYDNSVFIYLCFSTILLTFQNNITSKYHNQKAIQLKNAQKLDIIGIDLILISKILQEGPGKWYNLDGELVIEDGEVKGTTKRTGDSLLLDCRFELPWGKKLKRLLLSKVDE